MTAKQTPISIRPAREDDCSRVAEIGARAWKAIYDGYRAQLGPELFDTFYPEAIRHKCCSLREEMQTLPFLWQRLTEAWSLSRPAGSAARRENSWIMRSTRVIPGAGSGAVCIAMC